MNQPVPDSRNPEPGWRVVLAPWRHLFNPAAGARMIARGSNWARFAALAGGVLVLAYAATLLLMWGETVQYDWAQLTTMPASMPAGVVPGVVTHVRVRSISAVFDEWDRNAVVHALVDVPFLATLIICIVVGVLTLLTAPAAIGSDGLRMAVWRGGQAVAACMGWAVLLLVILLGTVQYMEQVRKLESAAGAIGAFDVMIFCVPAFPISALVLARRITRTAQAIAPPGDGAPLAPRCEGCGYDLSHRPESGRCPECGLDIDSSLLPGARRLPSAWDSVESRVSAWLATTRAVLMQPGRLYATVEVLGAAHRPSAFASATLWIIGLGALVWFLTVMILEQIGRSMPLHEDVLPLCVAVGAAAAAAGWAVHRGTALVALIGAAFYDVMPDARAARRVIAFETAYLWVFCGFNGVFATLSILAPSEFWEALEQTLGSLLPRDWAMDLLLAGNGGLILLWLWRYRTALRAVRWANF